MRSAVFVLTLLASVAQAQTIARPARPQVTLNADIKQLLFDWEPAAGATYYQIYARYPGTSHYGPFGERLPASDTHLTLPIPVHLQSWGTRYILGACNSAGCTSSLAMNSENVMLASVGYLKASNTGFFDEFGSSVTLSNDGYTLAVAAPGEDSSAIGVNGNQADNSVQSAGAVYVFRRRGNAWQQEAYVKAGVNQDVANFGASRFRYRAVALSAKGSILVVASPLQHDGGTQYAGVVYVYRRFQNAWSLVQTLHSPTPAENGSFGHSVDISRDGRTIKVTSIRSLDIQDMLSDTYTHIFQQNGSTWQHATTLAPFYPGDRCQISRMDGSGQTLVFGCLGGPTGARVVTMKRAGQTWVHVDDLPMPMPVDTFFIRHPIALNIDSSWMALRETGAGPVVGVYRWDGAQWVRARGFSLIPAGGISWGEDLAISDDGRLLAIGDVSANEFGAGVSPTSIVGFGVAGAVYVYQRGATPSAWTLRSVVKAPNPDFDDSFGFSVSLSASGRTLAVGAIQEDSNATGIDGDRTNNSASIAGTAYLY